MNLIPINFLNIPQQTPLRRMMLTYAMSGTENLTEYEVTGNPAVFNTNVEKPLTQLLVPFTPVQSGSGDPSPTNVRPITGWTGVTVEHCGKNLLNISGRNVIRAYNATYTINGSNSVTVSTSASNGYLLVKILEITDGMVGNAYVKNSENFFFATYDKSTSTVTVKYTPNNYYEIKQTDVGMIFASWFGNGTFTNLQVEAGTTATAYAPYSGTTIPVTFPALGKNLFNVNATPQAPSDTTSSNTTKRVWQPYTFYPGIAHSNWMLASQVTGYSVSNGTITIQNKNVYGLGFAIPLKGGQSYYVSATADIIKAGINAAFYADDGAYISGISTDLQNSSFNVPSGAAMTVMIFYGANEQEATFTNVMLNEGTTAQTYEPYTNTVYGGTLDLATGVLTVGYGIKDMGDLTWEKGTFGPTLSTYAGFKTTIADKANNSNYICSKYKAVNENRSNLKDNDIGVYYTSGDYYKTLIVRDDTYSSDDATTFKTASEGAKIVYELATPQTYQLDTVTIETLIGDNTIWSDTNGTNTIKYLKKG